MFMLSCRSCQVATEGSANEGSKSTNLLSPSSAIEGRADVQLSILCDFRSLHMIRIFINRIFCIFNIHFMKASNDKVNLLSIRSGRYIYISFQIERKTVTRIILLSISKENCHHDHIPFNEKENVYL